MKTQFFKASFCFAFLLVCVFISSAQNISDTTTLKIKGIIKFYPLQLIVGEVRFAYEKPLKHNISLEFSPGFIYAIIDGEIDGDLGPDGKFALLFGYYGVGLRGSLRLYTSSTKDHNGFFWSPLFLYKYIYHKKTYDNFPPLTENIQMFSFQSLVGYKYSTSKKVCAEVYGGLGVKGVFDNYNFHDPGFSYNTGTNVAGYITIQLGISIDYLIRK